jgi:hypothetical protein
MVPHKTNLSDPEVKAGCRSARKVQKMPPVRHNTATFTHGTWDAPRIQLNWRQLLESSGGYATNKSPLPTLPTVRSVFTLSKRWLSNDLGTSLRLYCRNEMLNDVDWFTTDRDDSLQNISSSSNAGYVQWQALSRPYIRCSSSLACNEIYVYERLVMLGDQV